MKVLFSHSYFLRFDPKSWRIMQPFAPLGTIQAAACIREMGHEVQVHDVMFCPGPQTIEDALDRIDPDLLVIYDDGFNYLTKMCLTNMREACFSMIRRARSRGVPVAVASSDSTDHYTDYLDAGADFVILGEGESTLMDLVRALDSGQSWDTLQGMAYRSGDRILHTGRRPLIRDLDSLPFPAWDLVDLEDYRRRWTKAHGYFSVNISTTRGCPFRCNWCAKPIYGNRYHARSPEHVIEEIRILRSLVEFEHIWFCDDIFGLKPGWVKRFAELVENERWTFRFKIQSRADLLLKDEQIGPLARAGCASVWMGAESGSQAILDAMDKGTRVEQIELASRLLRSHGIEPAFFLQFGYPGEKWEDIQLTLDLIRRSSPSDIGISVSYPLPGTPFYDRVARELGEKANWTDSDDLAMMFQNTYSAAFYRQLHRYVHAYFRELRWEQRNQEKGQKDARYRIRKIWYRIRRAREGRKLDQIRRQDRSPAPKVR